MKIMHFLKAGVSTAFAKCWGVLLMLAVLSGCGADDAEPATPVEAISEVLLSAVGKMLEADCGSYVPLRNDGSRTATINWFPPEDTTRVSEYELADSGPYSYELTNTGVSFDEPTLTLYRPWATGVLQFPSDPVTDIEDRRPELAGI